MNYLTEILGFYDYIQVNKLSTGQIALWHALMAINNKCGWREWFSVPNLTLELYTGLTRQSIVNNRNTLAQKGLIEFRLNRTKASSYKMVSIADILQGALQGTLQTSLQGALQESLQGTLPLNKLNKTKQNETKEKEKNIKKEKSAKHKYGEYNNVLLTDDDIERLKSKLPDTWQKWIETLSEGIELKGYTYKNHYLAILKWAERDKGKVQERQRPAVDKAKKSKFNNYVDTNETDYDALEEQFLDMMLEDEE